MVNNESVVSSQKGFLKRLVFNTEMWRKVKRYKLHYLILLIPVIHQIIFSYLPIYGVVIAFKDFKITKGIIGSPWNNFEHFIELFNDIFFYRVLRNTLQLSFFKIFAVFPCTIIFALLIWIRYELTLPKTIPVL